MLVEIMARLIGSNTGALTAIIFPAVALEKARVPRLSPRTKKKGINTQASRKEKVKPRVIFCFKRVKFLR